MEVWLLSGIFPDPVWEFSGTDIAALAVMGATLGDQDLIAILDAVQRPCAVDGLGEISFVPRKENRECGQADVLWGQAVYKREYLAVGDDEGWLFL